MNRNNPTLAVLLTAVAFLLGLFALIIFAGRKVDEVVIPASDMVHSMRGHLGLPHSLRCFLGFVALPGASWREKIVSWGATLLGWLMVGAVAVAILGIYIGGIAAFFSVGSVAKSAMLLTVSGTSYKEIIAKAQELLDTQRCMKRSQIRGFDPYNSHDTQQACYRKLFRDKGRAR